MGTVFASTDHVAICPIYKKKDTYLKGRSLVLSRWIKFSAVIPLAICTSTLKKAEKHIHMPCLKSFVQDFCLFAPGLRSFIY